ncbi:MAG TPA: hypothetical protein VGF75_07630 [Candidatus Saccharimonadales bacterium]|jgi:hypothetical protein
MGEAIADIGDSDERVMASKAARANLEAADVRLQMDPYGVLTAEETALVEGAARLALYRARCIHEPNEVLVREIEERFRSADTLRAQGAEANGNS